MQVLITDNLCAFHQEFPLDVFTDAPPPEGLIIRQYLNFFRKDRGDDTDARATEFPLSDAAGALCGPKGGAGVS